MSIKVSKEQLKVAPHFAIVCARGLGDALLSMILAHNLQLSGKSVTIFSSILCELKDWFPGFSILPYPPLSDLNASLARYSTVVAADHSILKENHDFGNQLLVLKESHFEKQKSMVENLKNVCVKKLNILSALSTNGIVPLKGLYWKKHAKRVLLHPTSSDDKKNWPAEKFIALSTLLENEGYEPFFCVSPKESSLWQSRVAKERLPHFPTVCSLASFVYESGYLIGNDSGVGHLASALNIPTLSLFARRSYSHLWRPGWGLNHVVSPPNILFGSRLKQKYWKKLLSVSRVKKEFDQLREATLAHPSPMSLNSYEPRQSL